MRKCCIKDIILVTLDMSSANALNLVRAKILMFVKELNLYRLITTLTKKVSENILGKGENADNQHFLLFQKMFSSLPKTN